MKSFKISSHIKFQHVIYIIWYLGNFKGRATDNVRIVCLNMILNSFITKLKTL